jgi:hypothetical protein
MQLRLKFTVDFSYNQNCLMFASGIIENVVYISGFQIKFWTDGK